MPAFNQSPTPNSAHLPKQTPDRSIDITAYLCPMTFVRTRLALDQMRSGQHLAVRLKGEEPRTNIPKSAAELGHQVLALTDDADGTTTVLIKKQ